MTKLRPLILVFVILSMLGCESAAQKQAKIEQEKALAAQVKAKAEAETKLQKEQATKAKAEAERAAEAKKATLSKLLKNFRKTTDKFDGTITYRHKSYTPYFNTNGTGIMAKIIGNRMHCNSTFVKSDWIFHTEFTVKTGDVVRDYTGGHQHEVVNGIAEAVNLNSSASEALAQQIAAANAKQPVMIRLTGKYTYDFNLRDTQRQAIKETLELYNALK